MLGRTRNAATQRHAKGSARIRAVLFLTFASITAPAVAQNNPGIPPAPATAADSTESRAAASTPVLEAYVESFYSWNFKRPANEINNFRGFDNRHDSFTLSNVALGVTGSRNRLSGKVTLQFGHTPVTGFLAEPNSPGAAGAGESDRFAWRHLQQAFVGWEPFASPRLRLETGLFLSPVGAEGVAVKDNWNWSRSNLFFGLPLYHAGARAIYAVSERTTLTAAMCNGWNNIVDNNRHKTVSAQLAHSRPRFDASLLYMGGVERPTGAPEGSPWRSLVDAWAKLQVTPRLTVMLCGNAGEEPGDLGTSTWWATALYARLQLTHALFLAGRGDWFREDLGSNAQGTASPIFWTLADRGRSRVASATLTLEARPRPGISMQAEYRYDDANMDLYFDRNAALDLSGQFVPNTHTQPTVTLGSVVWF